MLMMLSYQPQLFIIQSNMGGGKPIVKHQKHVALRITPHARTLRKARENVKWMVADQVSPAKIKRYFVQWASWWVKTATVWDFQMLVEQFISMCWLEAPAAVAADVLSCYFTALNSRESVSDS